MKKAAKQRSFLLVFLLGLGILLVGCSSKNEQTDDLPWSQPAEWEGRMPGFGGSY